MMERKTARIIALDLLAACRRDRSWSDGYLKAAIRKNGLDSRDAALTTRLGYGVLQNAGLLDFYIGCYCSQQPGHLEPVVLDVLRLGAYQILFMDRVPDSAAVSESVELVKRSGKERAAGMVNAVPVSYTHLAREEFLLARDYDYIVVNDAVENAVGALDAIMTAEHCRPAEQMRWMEQNG